MKLASQQFGNGPNSMKRIGCDSVTDRHPMSLPGTHAGGALTAWRASRTHGGRTEQAGGHRRGWRGDDPRVHQGSRRVPRFRCRRNGALRWSIRNG
jgi:hypothetical protein